MLIVASILVVLGVVGSVLPLLPGVPLIFIGYLLYGWATQFTVISGGLVLLALGLTVLSGILDWVAGSLGARRFGASPRGMLGALVGGIAGLFISGPIGIIAGTFIGAVLGELATGRTADEAMRAGWGSVLGLLLGTVARFVIAVTLAVLFFIRVI